MKYYFAPMEGITGYIYRQVHHQFFPGIDKYFTPFLTPGSKKLMTPKELRDILPDNNEGYHLVPQILTNQAQDFIRLAEELREYGYEEVNLNLGCPSGTVTAKKKGSGFLEFPAQLEKFLDEVFENLDMKISVKTRIGKDEPEEFTELLRIYNRFPLEELIVHPRIQSDYYKNEPRMEQFQEAVRCSQNSLCYNGDLFTKARCEKFFEEYPSIEKVMLGRGLLVNPALVQQVQKGTVLEKATLKAFHDKLCEEYIEVMSGDKNVLFKMKELWFYMGNLFADNQKYLKKIKKSQHLKEYQAIVEEMFQVCPLEIKE